MRIFVGLFAAVIVLVALPLSSVEAGLGAGDIEVGIETGFVHFDDEVADDTSSRLAVRLGYHISDLFQLELHGARSDTDELEPGDTIADTTLTTFFVDGVFNFHVREDVVPYALIGAGSADLEFETNLIDVQDDGFAARTAGGVRFLMGRNHRTAARIELAVMFEDAFDEDSFHENLTFGFSWRLGK